MILIFKNCFLTFLFIFPKNAFCIFYIIYFFTVPNKLFFSFNKKGYILILIEFAFKSKSDSYCDIKVIYLEANIKKGFVVLTDY